MSAQRVKELLEGHSVVRAKQQITLPPEIVSVLGIGPGDTLRFAARDDGTVTVQLLRLYLAPTPLEEALAAPAAPARTSAVDW